MITINKTPCGIRPANVTDIDLLNDTGRNAREMTKYQDSSSGGDNYCGSRSQIFHRQNNK